MTTTATSNETTGVPKGEGVKAPTSQSTTAATGTAHQPARKMNDDESKKSSEEKSKKASATAAASVPVLAVTAASAAAVATASKAVPSKSAVAEVSKPPSSTLPTVLTAKGAPAMIIPPVVFVATPKSISTTIPTTFVPVTTKPHTKTTTTTTTTTHNTAPKPTPKQPAAAQPNNNKPGVSSTAASVSKKQPAVVPQPLSAQPPTKKRKPNQPSPPTNPAVPSPMMTQQSQQPTHPQQPTHHQQHHQSQQPMLLADSHVVQTVHDCIGLLQQYGPLTKNQLEFHLTPPLKSLSDILELLAATGVVQVMKLSPSATTTTASTVQSTTPAPAAPVIYCMGRGHRRRRNDVILPNQVLSAVENAHAEYKASMRRAVVLRNFLKDDNAATKKNPRLLLQQMLQSSKDTATDMRNDPVYVAAMRNLGVVDHCSTGITSSGSSNHKSTDHHTKLSRGTTKK